MFLVSDDVWQIKQTSKKGRGVFARKHIPAGTIIGDYLGKVIRTAEYDVDNDKDGLYLMYLTDQASIYPDVTTPDIHLINHACNPNCWMYIYHGHTLFFALRIIDPGEELTISYLLSPKDESCDPCTHICLCQSEFCTGSMHLPNDTYELWRAFQKKEKNKTRMAKFIFGKKLPKLSLYPTLVPISPIYAAMRYPL